MKRLKLLGFVILLASACQSKPQEQVLIPTGPFKFGINPSKEVLAFVSDMTSSLNAQPMREITLPAFYIDRKEVTVADFTRYKPSAVIKEATAEEPIRGISWHEADAYCMWLGKRLPSEREWEKAARGADERIFVWGNQFDKNFANFGKKVLAPGSMPKDASIYGVMDMNGNVSEWTADTYKAYEGTNYQDENFGKNLKVIRGGSFYKRAHGFMKEFAMITHRNFAPPAMRALDTGFRCARDASNKT